MVDEAVARERREMGDDVTTWTDARRGWVQEVMALARRWYLQLIRDRLNLAFSLTQPAIWLAFFGSAVGRAIDSEVIGTSDYIGFMLPGVIAFTVVTNAMTGAMPLLWDKEVGYLDKLLAKPIARSSLIVSRFVFQFGLGTAQVILVFAMAVAITVEVASGPLGALAILAIAGLLSMSFTALFMALAYRVPTHGTFFAVSGFVSLPLVFLSNAFVPTDAMPDWMRWIAQLNPLTYAIEAMRNLVLDGWSGDVAGALLVLALFAAGSLALATYEFVRHTGERVR
ncbi:MAG: ABC transporter [Actinobacteria bacterium]|nr:ABC transporter [Actinomycetota bacterium]